MANSMEPCKMLWADPCCHGNEICARRGDPVAYRLVYLISLLRFYASDFKQPRDREILSVMSVRSEFGALEIIYLLTYAE